jgi:alcohol dehydrogenase (cytochrome c)
VNFLMALLLLVVGTTALPAQLSYERLLQAEKEPGNWLTYSGSYKSQHYSTLNQIRRDNVGNLELKWVFQARSLEKFEATPLVVDQVMYVTQAPNDVVALDARTGRAFWTYHHKVPKDVSLCCGLVNRGLAILGDLLFMGTVDAHLLALDAKSGKLVWDVTVADYHGGYALTLAPLVVKDRVIVGVAGGEYGIRGFLDAYEAKTGQRAWRFNTVPGPGEPGNETWPPDSWKNGGGSAWLTGSFDPELNLIYWGIGNPGPDWNGDVRQGDNLYTDSVVALDPDTGKLKWYFQFTPHDVWDFDAVQIPVLVDMEFRGRPRKLMLWGNRNGFYYVLDRVTGEYLLGKPFAQVTWAEGLDDKGRPIRKAASEPTFGGNRVYPGVQGATNWYAPSYHPGTGLFYLSVWEYASVYHKGEPTYTRGNRYIGSFPVGAYPNVLVDDDPGYSAVRALDPKTGELKWEHKMRWLTEGGVISTAGDVLFSGNMEGHFFALNCHTGELLWRVYLGGRVANSPITYLVDGEQHVSIAAGNSLYTFALKKQSPAAPARK